jgi:hypothetical protein
MAGGIEWFRWHHGSVTDPKFQLVARKAGASLPDVLAVWAYLLEEASAADVRGEFSIDSEAVDCMFGFEDGKTSNILAVMGARGILDGNRIASWDKRQPKKEDDTATDRKRRQRERENEAKASATGGASRHVTQCHADVTQCHARGEESREEKITDTLPPPPRELSVLEETLMTLPDEVQVLWWKWLAMRRFKHGPMSEIQQEAVLMELLRRGERMKADLELSILKEGKNILDSSHEFGKPNARGSPRFDSSKHDQARERSEEIKRLLDAKIGST